MGEEPLNLSLARNRLSNSVNYYLSKKDPETEEEAYAAAQDLYYDMISEFIREIAGGEGSQEVEYTSGSSEMANLHIRECLNQSVCKAVKNYLDNDGWEPNLEMSSDWKHYDFEHGGILNGTWPV